MRMIEHKLYVGNMLLRAYRIMGVAEDGMVTFSQNEVQLSDYRTTSVP